MGGTASRLLEDASAQQKAVLNISGNRLKILPPEIELVRETLVKLNLSNNLLTSLPFEFVSLQQLKYVNLSNNRFKLFPTVLNELKNLEIIDLSNNRISVFPAGLQKTLKALALNDNRIVAIPSFIVTLPNLIKLDLDDNPITYPPKEILQRFKKTSDIDWLIELKDWLLEHENAPSDDEPGSKGVSRSSTSVSRSSSARDDVVEVEDILERHARAKERLKRQHDEEIRSMEEQHLNQLQSKIVGMKSASSEPVAPLSSRRSHSLSTQVGPPTPPVGLPAPSQQHQPVQQLQPRIERNFAAAPPKPPVSQNVHRSVSVLASITEIADEGPSPVLANRSRSKSDAPKPSDSDEDLLAAVNAARGPSTDPIPTHADVETACNNFFRESQQRQINKDTEPLPLQAAKTFILANLQLWKAVKQALEASSNSNIAQALWRMQSEGSTAILNLVSAVNTLETTPSVQRLPKLNQVKKCASHLSVASRRLVKSFAPLLPVLNRSTDVRVMKSVLTLWKTAVEEVVTATRMLNLDIESRSTQVTAALTAAAAISATTVSSAHPDEAQAAASTPVVKLSSIPATMADTLVVNQSKVQAVINNTLALAEMLKEVINGLRTPDNNDKRFMEILAGLEVLVFKSTSLVNKLQTTLNSDPLASLKLRQNLLAETQQAVQSHSRLIAVARIVGLERPFSDALVKALGDGTRSSKDVMRLLPIDWNASSSSSAAVPARSAGALKKTSSKDLQPA